METGLDVAIVGGGVIGCAILHELSCAGYRCILLEKEPHLVAGASSGNSAMAHTGFDSTPETVECKLVKDTQELSRAIFTQLNIPNKRSGGLMVAWTEEELQKMQGIVQNAHAVGVNNVRLVSKSEIEKLEPNLNKSVLGGVLVPDEAVVDSWYLPVALAHQSRRLGAQVLCDSEVLSVTCLNNTGWELNTRRGIIRAKAVINAAGLYGDKVHDMVKPSPFRIKPREGQYLVYDKKAGQLIKHLLIPVPNERTKGIIVFPTVYGNLVVGPTAEDVPERHSAKTTEAVLKMLEEHAHKVLPALKSHKPIGSYAGLRPATEHKDYQIVPDKSINWITVGGIRSTGVSACLGIAKYVKSLVEGDLNLHPTVRLPLPDTVAMPWISDKPSVLLDGAEYVVTHPLTKFGLAKSKL